MKISIEKKVNKKVFILLFFNIIALILSINYIIRYNQHVEYRNIYIIPLAYMFLNIIFIKTNYNIITNGAIISKILLSVFWIRYFLMPFMIIYTNNYGGYGIAPSIISMNTAYILTVFEMIISFIIMYFFDKKYKSKVKLIKSNKVFLENKIVITIFILICIPIVIRNLNSFIPQRYLENIIHIDNNGFISILLNLFKTAVFLVLLSVIKQKNDRKNSNIYKLMAIVILLLYMIINFNSSRWGLIIIFISGIVLINDIFGSINKGIIAIILVICSIMLISISMEKFSWALRNESTQFRDMIQLFFSQLQDYFSGPRTIAQGIDAYNVFKENIGLSTLINDFIGSIPGIAGIVNQSDRINYYFNTYVLGYTNNLSLINPMISIGYSYFGILFSPLYSGICVFLALKIDNSILLAKNLDYKYVLIRLGFLFAMFGGYNNQIIFGNIVISIVPLAILLKVNSLIKK